MRNHGADRATRRRRHPKVGVHPRPTGARRVSCAQRPSRPTTSARRICLIRSGNTKVICTAASDCAAALNPREGMGDAECGMRRAHLDPAARGVGQQGGRYREIQRLIRWSRDRSPPHAPGKNGLFVGRVISDGARAPASITGCLISLTLARARRARHRIDPLTGQSRPSRRHCQRLPLDLRAMTSRARRGAERRQDGSGNYQVQAGRRAADDASGYPPNLADEGIRQLVEKAERDLYGPSGFRQAGPSPCARHSLRQSPTSVALNQTRLCALSCAALDSG